MKKFTKRWQLLIYGCSGIGVNLLNIIVGTYLCSALNPGGFDTNVEYWTYNNKLLVIPAVWGTMQVIAKIIDAVIDIPLSSFTDRLKTRWGRRRPSILLGLVPTLVTFGLFLIVPQPGGESWLNSLWFGLLLCIYYAFYTLTMLTYYATFAEVTQNKTDMMFLSNTKSVCDLVYFVLGFALIPMFVNMGINIKWVALMFMPLALTMLIPLFMLKEKSTKDPKPEQIARDTATAEDAVETTNQATTVTNETATEQATVDTATNTVAEEPPLHLWPAIKCAFQNKTLLYWMLTAAIMNFGLQLFLNGINEMFSTAGVSMTIVMACAFVPVPFTLILYNKLVKKHGLGWAYRFILGMFCIGMFGMYLCVTFGLGGLDSTILLIIAIIGALFASFSIGAFFSVGYTVPSHLAQIEYETKGISVSSMYFAVQGLIEGIAAAIATGVVLTTLKTEGIIEYMPIFVIISSLIAMVLSTGLPESISKMGFEGKPKLEVKE